jgi:hypothetical protein
MADAWQSFAELQKRLDSKDVVAGDLFGTREFLKNNYLYRFTGAKLSLYGNSGEEAIYLAYFVDATGAPADASKHRYRLTSPREGCRPRARSGRWPCTTARPSFWWRIP